MEFWVDWDLWEKMCSVLGCLIAIVLIYGFIILGYNKWKLKKYAAVEAQERMEGRILGAEDEEKDNIPFGARAIERGIQVDGIWISNSNSPLNSPRHPGTPAESRRASSTTKTSSQETLKPPPIMVTACDGISPPSDTPHPYMDTPGFQPQSRGRGVSSGLLEVNGLSADGENLKRNETLELERSRHDYTAYQTYIQPGRCNSPVDRPAPAYTTLDEERRMSNLSLDRPTEAFDRDFNPYHFSDSSERLVNSPSQSAPTQPVNSRNSHEDLKLNPKEDSPFNGGGGGDLGSLRAHRLSHVAETGQLGSSRNSQVGAGDYDQGVHPQELAVKLEQVKEEEEQTEDITSAL